MEYCILPGANLGGRKGHVTPLCEPHQGSQKNCILVLEMLQYESMPCHIASLICKAQFL